MISTNAFGEIKKADPIPFQNPVNPNQSITFQDLQEFKVVIYGMVIVFLLNLVFNMGKIIWGFFKKEKASTDDLLKQLVEEFNEMKGDVREIKVEIKNRPKHSEVVTLIYEHSGRKTPR